MTAETEGIALLSMYGEDEDDEESIAAAQVEGCVDEDGKHILNVGNDPVPQPIRDRISQILTAPPPIRSQDGTNSKTVVRNPLSHSPSSLAIVDYAHDEAAMSPGAGGMELVSDVGAVSGTRSRDGIIEGTITITSQTLSLSSQQTPSQRSDIHELSNLDVNVTMDFVVTKLDVAEVKTTSAVYADMQIENALNNFLPPPVTTRCPDDLQDKINKFLAYKMAGKSFNADFHNKKDYRNPNFLQHAVNYQGIDEFGTCFSKEIFDPHGYEKSDFYDEIDADMKRELEKRAEERKSHHKIDIVSGSIQPAGLIPPLKTNAPLPGAGIPDTLTNKKS